MRKAGHGVEKQFTERWSSREYDGAELTREQRDMLFEAARWTPSSYNEQPWKFHYPKTEEKKEEYFSLLAEGNREWVKNAGFLCIVSAKRMLTKTGEPNRFCAFDTGAAWMALALQARAMGLSAHAMGGFDDEKAYGVLGISREEREVLAAIAVGRPTRNALETEERTGRKDVKEIAG